MTINTLEPINRPKALHPPKALLSGRVVPFKPEPDPAIYRSPEDQEESHNSVTHRLTADSYAITDPLEYFFYSVISGAALVSVLIGILSLPSVYPAKSDLLKTGTSQTLESSLAVQNRG
jgi:hypothetical protein